MYLSGMNGISMHCIAIYITCDGLHAHTCTQHGAICGDILTRMKDTVLHHQYMTYIARHELIHQGESIFSKLNSMKLVSHGPFVCGNKRFPSTYLFS